MIGVYNKKLKAEMMEKPEPRQVLREATGYEDIEKAGANAYRLGRNMLDNPYYESEKMPKSTGDRLEEWQRKATAWEVGYRIEQLMSS